MLDTITQQALLDAISSAAVVVDETGAILSVNRAWQRFSEENGGDSSTFYLGRNYFDVCGSARSESSAEAPVVAKGLRAVLEGQDEFRCEYPCHSPTELRWFEVAISPMVVSDRRLALVMHHNITRRRRQQEDVRRSQIDSSALAALVASSSDAIISFDLDGIIETWNPAATALYGYSAEEVLGRSVVFLLPEGAERFAEIRDQILAGELERFEAARRTKSGELRDVAISAAPVRGADGAIVSILGIHRDITEEKATREHLDLVTRELSHRAKNLLAIVLSLERQTARSAGSLDDFRERLSARLRSLGASLDLLAARSWGRVSLEELARSQLGVFVDVDAADELSIRGPPVLLDAEAVEALGMVLHELGTNALKYGALGAAGGAIRLDWDVSRSAEGERLLIRWNETSPAISGPPARPGFGHTVLTRIPAQKLGAEIDIAFTPGRLRWTAALSDGHFGAARHTGEIASEHGRGAVDRIQARPPQPG